MPRVAILSARPDFAHSLARCVERTHPDYRVDTFTSAAPVTKRVVAAFSRRYDLVQADELVRNGPLGATVRAVRGVPLVTVVRGWADYLNAHGEYSGLREASIRVRVRELLDRSDVTLFLSEVCREEIRRAFPVGESAVVRRPFDRDAYADEHRTRTDPDLPVRLLTVTNLRYASKARGVAMTIRALEPLFEAQDLRYQVAGDGREADIVADAIEKSSHSDRIHLLGYREDVPSVLAGADLFVYLSFLDAYPTAVLEAQAAGLPVLVGGTSGVAEAAGTAGEVCPPTVEGLRHGVDALLSSPERFSDAALASRERMADYNESAATDFVTAWDSVLERRF